MEARAAASVMNFLRQLYWSIAETLPHENLDCTNVGPYMLFWSVLICAVKNPNGIQNKFF